MKLRYRVWNEKRKEMEYISDLYWFEESGVHDSSGEGHYDNYIIMPSICVPDKNGKEMYVGDIVQYINPDDFDCQSIVKIGEYIQDGSGGEYRGRTCLGVYVEVDNFTCPDWCEDEPERFPYHMRQQNILEVANNCEVIGNIYENPELVKNEE